MLSVVDSFCLLCKVTPWLMLIHGSSRDAVLLKLDPVYLSLEMIKKEKFEIIGHTTLFVTERLFKMIVLAT